MGNFKQAESRVITQTSPKSKIDNSSSGKKKKKKRKKKRFVRPVAKAILGIRLYV